MKRNIRKFSYSTDVKAKLIYWASQYDPCVILDSHSTENRDYPLGFKYELVLGVGKYDELSSNEDSFEKLKEFHSHERDWLLGYFSYDLKNELELVSSKNEDHHNLPNLYFFVPETVITVSNNEISIECLTQSPKDVWNEISTIQIHSDSTNDFVDMKPRMHHAEYIRGVKSLLHHIQIGDIYEANFCQEFYVENAEIEPFGLYQKLMQTSPTPFSAYCHFGSKYLMCASPERFMNKTGTKIISQPIKGTAKRSPNVEEDAQHKLDLFHSKKDRTENVMIVDLVRNDLSRTAKRESVKVEELFGVYSFSNVHQMISTILSELDSKHHFTEAIKNAFPMGSMTGAPKIMATELIDQFEHTKRGLYSGSVGYITPEGDFDFNVVIRSLQYNAENRYLSYMVGGAITHNSDPEEEYVECELKAEALKKVLGGV